MKNNNGHNNTIGIFLKHEMSNVFPFLTLLKFFQVFTAKIVKTNFYYCQI